jgi:4-diphosphocytidyl-2-C-methyl-D-erythritol kinase
MSGASRLRPVSVRVPGKVNIGLWVGSRQADGYHELRTIFQTVALYDQVTIRPAHRLRVRTLGPGADQVPDDGRNLAGQAAVLLAGTIGADPAVSIQIRKELPVAGGMAGGSADAAAVLVAGNEFWAAGLELSDLHDLASQLGSDVPFMIGGGTALGQGRGDLLTPIPVRAPLHWVLALSSRGLSTSEVFAEFDRDPPARRPLPDRFPAALPLAVRDGHPAEVARLLHNDLQDTAIRLRPDLARLLQAGTDLGACGAIITGTGATCAFLCAEESSARGLATALEQAGACRAACYAAGPALGPQLMPMRT